ncbi:MAG: flavin reductase family protein [Gemmatimonadales bacterium]|jgi:flavin reductase (DIM6/NTAB) family NADH-FMN oxidoreductase RutF
MSEIADLFRQLTFGVYVVGVADGERRDAFTAAWVVQTSFEPLMLAVSVNPQNASHPILRAGGSFTVNVLRQGQIELARWFGTRSGRDEDKLVEVRWHPGRRGAPILDDSLAYFECELGATLPAGDHELVLGTVIDGGILAPGSAPMTYAETGEMDGSRELFPRRF